MIDYTTFDYVCYFPKTVGFNNGYYSGVDIENAVNHFAILALAETDYTSVYYQEKDKVAINATVKANGGQHGTAIRGNLWNYSHDGRGCTALYGQAVGTTYGRWSAAVHGETKHLCTLNGVTAGLSVEVCTFSEYGKPYGLLVNNTTGTTGETILGKPELPNPNIEAISIVGEPWRYGINITATCEDYFLIKDKRILAERQPGFPENLPLTPENWTKLLNALRTHGLIGD